MMGELQEQQQKPTLVYEGERLKKPTLSNDGPRP
jgi:hypothetical protein